MELLVKIFGLYICPDSLEEGIYARRQHLASISRRWKDVVLHTPTFWKCTIHTPSTSPFLNTRSERSGQALLDIKITDWGNEHIKTTLMEGLRIIAPYYSQQSQVIYGLGYY